MGMILPLDIHHHSCDVAVKLLYYNCYDSSGLMFELQQHKTHAPQHHQGPVGQSLGDLSATSPQFAVVDVHDSWFISSTKHPLYWSQKKTVSYIHHDSGGLKAVAVGWTWFHHVLKTLIPIGTMAWYPGNYVYSHLRKHWESYKVVTPSYNEVGFNYPVEL